MTLFADASALVAIAGRETDWADHADRISRYRTRLYSAISAWETVAALCRGFGISPQDARQRLHRLVSTLDMTLVSVAEREFQLAADAYARFGKGRHPAALNMGDCYAYACARANDARLLFKGDDFARTDIDRA